MAPTRPYWKGYLKLSLVSCHVSLYSATSTSERVTFRQINRATGNRLRQQMVDEVTREPVEGSDKVRGYEYAKNSYVMVEDEELDAIAIESTHTIEIDKFVPRAQIDGRYYDSPYYLVPSDPVGQEAFAVVREAMRGKQMVALGRVVLAKRERVIMLEPWDKGLVGVTLRYGSEVRDAKEYFDEIPAVAVAADMRNLAEHILDSKAADFEPNTFVDRYEEAVIDMLRKKQAGLPMPKGAAPPPPSNVINLMDALKRSLEAGRGPAPAPAKRGKKKIEGQREMLLPLAGKGQAQKPAEKPKSVARPGARRKAG